jgi:hypothetical protein
MIHAASQKKAEGHSEVCIRPGLVFWAGLRCSDVVGLCALRVLALAEGILEQTMQFNEPKPDDLCAFKKNHQR